MTEYLSAHTLEPPLQPDGPLCLEDALFVLREKLNGLQQNDGGTPQIDLQDLGRLFVSMLTGRAVSESLNVSGIEPRWVSRFTQRLGQSAPDSFQTASEALDYLNARAERLAGIHKRIGARDEVRVPNLLECLYVMPSTVCNLGCRFCAYPKSSIPRRLMSNELFSEVIDKACAYGFTTFGLTPLLGEALIDPRFLDKLELLERHPAVTSYSFCTNFTVAEPEFRNRIRHLRKLQWMSVSIYGHDEESFTSITTSPGRLFLDVLSNLERLIDWPDIASHLELRIRTSASFELEQCHPRLREIISVLTSKNVRIRIPNDRFSNWSGLISADDLVGLDIHLKPELEKGDDPCAFLFYKHTVLPDGRLNACYADDGNATMVIGDLSRQSFEEIYSLSNDAYLELLLSHHERRFSPTCQACTGYRPVRDQHYSYAFHQKPFLTMSEFFSTLE